MTIDSNLLPPPDLQELVGGGYISVGKHFINKFNKEIFFNKSSVILDAGCGPGRIAIHFIDKLSSISGGELHGFDCHEKSIKWAQKNISQKHPNFVFKYLDVYNCFYNPHGILNNPNEVEFPYENDYFDFTFATSLFTHLTRSYTERYLDEIYRISKSGSIVAATFMSYEEKAASGFCEWINKRLGNLKSIKKQLYTSKKDQRSKLYRYDEVSCVQKLKNPSQFIAYRNDYLEDLIQGIGFTILQKPLGFQALWVFNKS